MPERRAFLDAIRAQPDEAAPRLIYADWLDEHGESLRADLIRYQVAASRLDADGEAHEIEVAPRHYKMLMLEFDPPGSAATAFVAGFLDRFSDEPATRNSFDTLFEARDRETLDYANFFDPYGMLYSHPLALAAGRILLQSSQSHHLEFFARSAESFVARRLELRMRAESGIAEFRPPPSLQSLDVSATRPWHLQTASGIIAATPGLRSLEIASFPVPTDWISESIRLPDLEHLDVRGESFGAINAAEFAHRLKADKLRSIRLEGRPGRIEQGLFAFPNPARLERLRLEALSDDGAALARIARRVPNLRSLLATGFGGSSAMRERELWPRLERLVLTGYNFDDLGLASGDLLPSLQTLIIYGPPGEPTEYSQALATRSTSGEEFALEALDLQGVGLTAAQVADMADINAPLEAIRLPMPSDRPLNAGEVRRLAASRWGGSLRAIEFDEGLGDALDEEALAAAIDAFGPRCREFWTRE